MEIKFIKTDERAFTPKRATEYSAGADLYALCDEDVVIPPHTTALLHTGICMEIPFDCCGLIFARSGLASKKGLAPANKVGLIDADYRGEIMVALHNHSELSQTVCHGERIAQLVIMPYVMAQYSETDSLSNTLRGEGGFGSTGTK